MNKPLSSKLKLQRQFWNLQIVSTCILSCVGCVGSVDPVRIQQTDLNSQRSVQVVEWQWSGNPEDPRKRWLNSIQPQAENSGLFVFRSVVVPSNPQPTASPETSASPNASVVFSTPGVNEWLESLTDSGAMGWWIEVSGEPFQDWLRLLKFVSSQGEFSTSWSPRLSLAPKKDPISPAPGAPALAEAVNLESNMGVPYDEACKELARWINANLWLASKNSVGFASQPGKTLTAKCRFELSSEFNLMPATWIFVGQLSLPWISNKASPAPFRLASDLNVDGVLKTLRSWQ